MPEEAKYCSMTCLKLEEEVLISFLTPGKIYVKMSKNLLMSVCESNQVKK